MVNKDEIVALTVSAGAGTDEVSQEQVEVPNVIGYSRERAETTLKEAGLNVGSVGRKPSSEAVGTVISQSPSGDKRVPKNSRVNIVLSSGPNDEEVVQTQKPANTAAASSEPENTATAKPTDRPTSTPVPEKNEGSGGTTKRFSLVVPEEKTDAQIKITANGETVYDEKHNGGDRVSVDITSSGQTNILAYIDGDLVSNKQIDFG